MKYLFTLLTASVLLFSFSHKDKPPIYDLKFIEKNLSRIPAGILTARSDRPAMRVESFYMFNQEVSNGFYLQYVRSLQSQEKSDLSQKALPDTLVWRDKLSLNEPYTQYYFRHPAYHDYPLTGVTHAQSIAFCSWLTKVYNSDPKRRFKKVTFTLPDSVQREYAALGGLNGSVFPWGGPNMQNSKGAWLANFRIIDQANLQRTLENGKSLNEFVIRQSYSDLTVPGHADVTAPVTSYYPNGYGLYNMSGNVEEFLLHEGETMGGSWMDPGYYLQNHVHETYDSSRSASRERGFRFIMKVLEE